MRNSVKKLYFVIATFAFASYLMIGCSKDNSNELKQFLKTHALQYNIETYQLEEIEILDTLAKKEFILSIKQEMQAWHAQYSDQFIPDYNTAWLFFNQEHVKHLHKQKLIIEELSDSIALIHEYLNSFVNEQKIQGQYLNELSRLESTRLEVSNSNLPIVYILLQHQYFSKENMIQEELIFFPEDSSFMIYDPILTPLEIYNQHKFQSKTML